MIVQLSYKVNWNFEECFELVIYSLGIRLTPKCGNELSLLQSAYKFRESREFCFHLIEKISETPKKGGA